MAMPTSVEMYGIPIVNPEGVLDYFQTVASGVQGSLHGILALVADMDVMVSTRPHKQKAAAKAMGYHRINRRLLRLPPLTEVNEPNWIKATPAMLRGKSIESTTQFKLDYPMIMAAIAYFKTPELELEMLIQDVRPKVGSSGAILSPLTNPGGDINENNLHKYIRRNFNHGSGSTTIRLENGLDRPVFGFDEDSRRVEVKYPYSPIVATNYVTYERNPLYTNAQVLSFLGLCRKLPGNANLRKNIVAAGGVLNEIAIYDAVMQGNGVDVSIMSGLMERTTHLPVSQLLESVYSKDMVTAFDKKHLLNEDSGHHEEWLRNFAVSALSVYDYARGGAFEAFLALFGQVAAGRSENRNVTSVIDLQPDYHVQL